MSVAIRTATRIQDQDDAPSLGAGQDGYALTWDNASGAFVATALSASGLAADGSVTGATAQAQAFTNGIIGPSWKPSVNSTTALQLRNAAGDYVLNVDTSNKLIGIGTDTPGARLHVKGSSSLYTLFKLSDTKVGYEREWSFSAEDSIFDIKDVTAGNLIRLAILSNGNVGIGTAEPATLLHTLLASAATNAVTNVLTIGHNTSGTAANGFGAGQLFALESSTTAGQSAARIQALWYEATHATFKADLVGTAYDAGGEREGWRVRGNGSAAAIGFLGAAPVARQAHVADPAGGATVDAEARSAINSILATLEGFGFHATS